MHNWFTTLLRTLKYIAQSRDDLLEDLLKEPDEITIKRKQIRENLKVLQQAYKVSFRSSLVPPFRSLGTTWSPPTLAFHLTFLLHHADFGRDTTWRRGSREGWILLPRFWCDWSTKGPWAFFIPPRIQWWKLTIFNPEAVKVKEVKPFWRAAPFQPQYEWQWFLMPPYTTGHPDWLWNQPNVQQAHLILLQVCWHP
jgi:hypothetical protein